MLFLAMEISAPIKINSLGSQKNMKLWMNQRIKILQLAQCQSIFRDWAWGLLQRSALCPVRALLWDKAYKLRSKLMKKWQLLSNSSLKLQLCRRARAFQACVALGRNERRCWWSRRVSLSPPLQRASSAPLLSFIIQAVPRVQGDCLLAKFPEEPLICERARAFALQRGIGLWEQWVNNHCALLQSGMWCLSFRLCPSWISQSLS